MDIIPWRPFGSELISLRQEMDRLWDRFVGESPLEKEDEEKNEHHYRAERYYGSFQRSFQLPSSVKADKIEAEFEKGC
jgi:hypothetical protein